MLFRLVSSPRLTPSWSGLAEPDLVPSRTSLIVSHSFIFFISSSQIRSHNVSFFLSFFLLLFIIIINVHHQSLKCLLSLFVTGLIVVLSLLRTSDSGLSVVTLNDGSYLRWTQLPVLPLVRLYCPSLSFQLPFQYFSVLHCCINAFNVECASKSEGNSFVPPSRKSRSCAGYGD